MIVYFSIRVSVLLQPSPSARARKLQPVFMVLTIMVSALFLLIKGPKAIQESWKWAGIWFAVVLALAIGVGVTVVVTLFAKAKDTATGKEGPAVAISPSPAAAASWKGSSSGGGGGGGDACGGDACGGEAAAAKLPPLDAAGGPEGTPEKPPAVQLDVVQLEPESESEATVRAADLGAELEGAGGAGAGSSKTQKKEDKDGRDGKEGKGQGQGKLGKEELSAIAQDDERLANDRESEMAEEMFKPLLVISALSVAFAHGMYALLSTWYLYLLLLFWH